MSSILRKTTIVLFSLFFVFVVCLCGGLLNDNKQINLVSADSISNASELTLDTQLERYLIELNGGEDLTADSFNAISELVFDGAQSGVCNGITEITGLSQFRFNNLTTITIRNMTQLVSVDLQGNNNSVFPNLKNINIENCTALTRVDFTGNNLSTINISASTHINFTLDSATAQSLTNLSLSDIAGDNFSINYTMPNLTQATFEDNSALREINIQGSSLRNLYIVGNTHLTNLYVDSSVLSNLTLQNNTNLQVLDLSRATNLRNLQLDEMTFEENGYVVAHTLVYAPNLKKLFLSYNDWIEQFDISQSSNIETIIFTDCTNLKSLLLSDTLQSLQTLDVSNCYNLSEIDFSSAENLQSLSLLECNLINVDTFGGISAMKGLEYLNLQGTNIREVDLEEFNNLQILFLGSSYLNSVYIDNLPNLFQFSIVNSNNLSEVTLNNANSLRSFNLDASEGITTINISNVALTSFSIAGKTQLMTLNLNCENLTELYIYDCENLSTVDFANCTNLTTLELLGCDALGSSVVDNLANLNALTHLYVSECDTTYSFTLSNKPYLNYLNISNLNNLTILSLTNIGTNADIRLPSNMTTIRSLTLSGLNNADFGTTELDLSNGVLSAVTLEYLPFTSINLNNNAITSLTISNIYNLLYINVANNRITNVDSIMALLEASPQLAEVNLNNNRLDFGTGNTLESIQGSIYGQCVIIGIQNIIEDNDYAYEPEVYFGGFGRFYPNIDVVVYHSSDSYSKANLTDSVLNEFSRSSISTDRFTQFSNGTYYITYQKVDNSGNVIEMTDEEKTVFLPIYFTVSTEFDFIQFIWIIFLVVAGLIFIYVGISFWIEKRRKARLLSEDYEDGVDPMSSTMSRKEIKQAEREHRKLFKESEKLDKQEKKNQALIDKGHQKEQKELEKEQRAQKAENDKLAKLAEREHKKEEKERKKEEKEQEKLDKEREKLLNERKKEQEKADAKFEKEKKEKEEKVQVAQYIPREKVEKEKSPKEKKVKEPKEDKNTISTKVDKSQIKAEKEAQKEREREQKEMAKLEKERQKMIKEREEENMFKDKAREKELKREQKELKRLEKQSLKEEKMREKAEDKALFSDDGEIKPKRLFEKFSPKDDNFDDVVLGLSANAGPQNNAVEDIDDSNTISDKDLEEIMKEPPKSPKPKMPKQPPKLPKL